MVVRGLRLVLNAIQAVRHQSSVEQLVIGEVGQHAVVQIDVVRQALLGLAPHHLDWVAVRVRPGLTVHEELAACVVVEELARNWTNLDRERLLQTQLDEVVVDGGARIGEPLAQAVLGRETLVRRRDNRHLVLVAEARLRKLGDLVRGHQDKDHLAFLRRSDGARHVRAAIASAANAKDERDRIVARDHKIGMQRVNMEIRFDGFVGSSKR